MSKNYSVDEILAEINAKKGKPEPPAQQQPKAPATPAPFSLSGMEDTVATPAVKVAAPIEHQSTRINLPLPTAQPKSDVGATRVIPAITQDTTDLMAQRQKKIEEFMKNARVNDQDDLPVSQPKGIVFDKKAYQRNESETKPKGSLFDKKFQKSKGEGKAKAIHAESDKLKKARQKPEREDKSNFSEEEYNAPRDAQSVSRELTAISNSLTVRLVINAICFAALFYLGLCNLFPLPLLSAIAPETDMRLFIMVNLIVFLISALFSATVLGGGLVALFNLRADHDTPAAIAVCAVVMHGAACVINPSFVSVGTGYFYFVVAALILLMNAVGKILVITRISQNFDIASTTTPLYGQYILGDSRLTAAICEPQSLQDPCLSITRKIEFPARFLELSYTDDYSESINKLISPLFLGFGVILSAIATLGFGQSGMEALTIFTVVACIASPLSVTLVGSVPLLRASNALAKEGAVLSGYEAVDEYDKINAISLSALELYPPRLATLHNLVHSQEGRADEALVNAASVFAVTESPLRDAFLGAIGGDPKVLRPVDAVRLVEGGISAQVGGEEILLGNRALVETLGIRLPDVESERKLAQKGREVLYYVVNNRLAVSFIVSYQPCEDARRAIDRIVANEPALIVMSADPNITPARIARDFVYPEEYIMMLSPEMTGELAKYIAPTPRGDAYVLTRHSHMALRMMAAIYSVKQSINWATVVQLSGLIIGYALAAFLAFTGAITKMGFIQLLLYQVIWTLATVVLSSTKKI